ncbi:MAG: CHAT domain-containing protein [Acidobacteria bacterium]|nr:CHAT domain-containing protein [Acidobacteriota bacterium]
MASHKARLIGSLSLCLVLALVTNAQPTAPASVAELAAGLLAAPDEAGREALLTTPAALVNEALADRLAELGRQQYEQNQFDKALAAFQLSRQLAEKLSYAKGVVTALTGLGNAQSGRSDLKAALATYTELLTLAERDGERTQQANAHSNLCRVQMLQGELARAAEHCQTGLQIAEAERNQRLIAIILSNLGIVARQRGEYEQALAFYRRSLTLAEALGDKTLVGRLLNNLGVAYRALGNETAALRYYQQSLLYAEAAGNQLGVASTLGNISMIQRALGNYAQALGLSQRALAMAEKLGDKFTISQALLEIGSTQRVLGNYEQALPITLRSVALAEETGNQLQTAITWVSVGDCYWYLNRMDEARTAYERALSLAETVNSPFTITVTQAKLAHYYLRKEDYQMALKLSEAAVARDRQTGARQNLWLSLLRAGVAARLLNQPAEARRYFDESISVIEVAQLELAASERNQATYWESRLDPYRNLTAMLVLQGQPVEAWQYVERAKARVLLDTLNAGKINLAKSLTPAEQQQERQYKDALTVANTRMNRAAQNAQTTAAQRAELITARESARLDYEAFQTQLYAAHPELRIQRGQAPLIQLPELSQLLDGQSAALEFSILNEATYLFVITRTPQAAQPEVRSYVLPLKRDELERQVSAFRRQLADRDVTFRSAAKQLYDLLLKPAQAQLAGKTQLIIVPDGKLWELPFQALVTPKNQYLIETAAVSYAPSLTVLREMQAARARRGKPSGELLAFGNPAFGGETVKRIELAYRDAKLQPLPEAEAEVKALGQLYGAGSKVYTNAAAREDRLKAEAAQAGVLHIATHGVLNDAAPLYSHLALAANDEKEDGLLEAWELMQMDLKADLAVLSACETARGRIGAGEGVIGLSWALFVAGVPSTLVSQWKVESSSTRDLMLGFHRGLRNKSRPLTKAEALRQAVLSLLKSPRTDHPFYWAGFVLVGDGR